MSCNIRYKNKKLVEVVNDQGEPSQLYKEAISTFGEDKALDIYLTSKSDEFMSIFGVQEPNLKTVMNYITEDNQTKEPLNKEQKIDLQDFALGVENFDTQTLVNAFYDEFGIFSISPAKLKASKLYSDYEIRNLQNDVELQEKVKKSIEALKNTEDVEIQQDTTVEVEKTSTLNSFGKLTNLNPFIVQKEITEKLGGTTEEEFNQIIEDLDYPNFQNTVNKETLFQEMQGYKKADVFIEVEGEIRQKNNTETEITIPLTTKVITNQTVKNNINSLINIRLDVLSENYEQTKEVLKAIEDDLIGEGLDIVGLSEKPIDPELIEFLQELNLFVNNPSKENTKIYANVSDKYFERDINPAETVVKVEQKLEYVKLNTNLSEEEVYVKNGLIKVKDGLYIKSAKEDLDTLYANVSTYTEKYPKDKTIQEYVQEQITTMNDFNNAENAEAVALYKMYFEISPTEEKVQSKNTQNFNGNVEYLTGEFISDFWAKSLKTKQKNNLEWKNYYGNFGVNERGLYLINDDILTISKIKEYADENIKQYSLLSKQMPDLTKQIETVQTRQSARNNAVNTPNNVEDFNGQIFKLNDNEIIIKDSNEDFIKIGGEVFENINIQGSLKHYVKLEANKTEYNSMEVVEPITKLNIVDYIYLEQNPQNFTDLKKYPISKTLEEFDC